jgi:hypothetical protein
MSKERLTDIILTIIAAVSVFLGAYFSAIAVSNGSAFRVVIISGTVTFVCGIVLGAKENISAEKNDSEDSSIKEDI